MRRLFRGLTVGLLGLALAGLAGCGYQTMTSSLVIGPHATSTMHLNTGAACSMSLVNPGPLPVDVHMYCDGSLSAIECRLEPGGRCRVGLTGVHQIVLHNPSGGRATIAYRAVGRGDVTVSAQHPGRYAMAD
ncbi:MAG: hypothetical protein JSV91_12315 [Phycisphaerales bacterium]|nr:MAG: hypothetical protein JSV91_12315 [Phycisphaerales bacterium]